MIEIKIPKEIKRYEARAIGPFTLRQTLCLLVCLPCCIGLYLLLSPYVGTDIAGVFVFIPAGIAYLFGWYKPYGMKFEKYMQTVFVSSFLAPSKRVYRTENFYEKVLKEIEKEESAASFNSSGKSSVKNKTKKYRRSKEAFK